VGSLIPGERSSTAHSVGVWVAPEAGKTFRVRRTLLASADNTASNKPILSDGLSCGQFPAFRRVVLPAYSGLSALRNPEYAGTVILRNVVNCTPSDTAPYVCEHLRSTTYTTPVSTRRNYLFHLRYKHIFPIKRPEFEHWGPGFEIGLQALCCTRADLPWRNLHVLTRSQLWSVWRTDSVAQLACAGGHALRRSRVFVHIRNWTFVSVVCFGCKQSTQWRRH
jgi:hypothetical protein